MKRVSRWAPLIILLIFIGAAIIYSESLKTRIAVGAPAPEFHLPLFDGGTVSSKQFLGKPVFVNFWAAWCPPCLEEMPAHDEFYKRYADRIGYVAVNERETVSRIERHLREVAEMGLTMDLPIALDRRGTVGEAYRIGGMPETWLIDGDGIARQHWIGPVTFEQMADAYKAATGVAIDLADGGPFHGTTDVKTVWATSDLQQVYIGGKGGLARYPLTDGGAVADEFEWIGVAGADVFVLLSATGNERDDNVAADGKHDEFIVVTDGSVSGLPADPSDVGVDGNGRYLAWVPGHGLFETMGDVFNGPWQPLPSDLPKEMPWAALAASPFTKDHWVAATAAGLYESRDGGSTWRALSLQRRSFAAAFDPDVPRRLYVATFDGVWVSDDDGRTNKRLPAAPQRTIAALHALPFDDGTVVVAAAPNGDVYIGRSGGERWQAAVPARTVR